MTDSLSEPMPIPGCFGPKAAEDRFRLAAGIASDLIYEWNIADDTLEWFGDIDRMLGFQQGEFSRTVEAWVICVRDSARQSIAKGPGSWVSGRC